MVFLAILSIATFTGKCASSLSTDYFDARPTVQIKGDYVNITYIAIDPTEITLVQVVITYPNNNTENNNMNLKDGKYVYNHTYEMAGKHVFYIVVEDIFENKNETANKTFWITADMDDTDDDGMPDWWEEKHGFDRFNPDDAEEDKDEDGYTNVEEYNNGTHPLSKSSLIQDILYKFKKNWEYLFISFLLFISVILLSLYGLSGRK